jgi:methylenetetrahydrofolate dehydrogenase (NADP+)/methenyltetrahydrofolate cyclohydrolase
LPNSAKLIDGVAIGKTMRAELGGDIARLQQHGVTPGLAAVLVGDHPASATYVRMKGKACDEVGLYHETITRPADIGEADLLALVDRLNADPKIHGILVQLPLPEQIDEDTILASIDPAKDVDGFHPVNVGRLATGQDCLVPCTPLGVREMLIRERIQTRGRHAVVVGRSNIVGKPMVNLLLRYGEGGDATVTVCHSKTVDLGAITRQAEILIVAIGRAQAVTREMVRPGAVVIDVGINRVPDPARPGKTRLVGDVDFEGVSEVAGAITPVPGGVGPMTIAMLLANTLKAAETAAGARAAR